MLGSFSCLSNCLFKEKCHILPLLSLNLSDRQPKPKFDTFAKDPYNSKCVFKICYNVITQFKIVMLYRKKCIFSVKVFLDLFRKRLVVCFVWFVFIVGWVWFARLKGGGGARASTNTTSIQTFHFYKDIFRHRNNTAQISERVIYSKNSDVIKFNFQEKWHHSPSRVFLWHNSIIKSNE